MKKLFILALAIATTTTASFAQETKKDAETLKTKMDVFTSKTGTITKYIDTKFPDLKGPYGGAETRIRKIISGSTSFYFYQITNKGKYSNSTASIEYSDLLEVIKAMKSLQASVAGDVSANPDYLENKFITVDGFQVGYYVDGGKPTWYLKLEKYGSDATFFVESGEAIATAFNDAKAKIDELKK